MHMALISFTLLKKRSIIISGAEGRGGREDTNTTTRHATVRVAYLRPSLPQSVTFTSQKLLFGCEMHQ
jgi:hypothetical protein